ncbi:MAG: hypothetical protein R3F54_31840 [Alphaproteobacteria bacterium]
MPYDKNTLAMAEKGVAFGKFTGDSSEKHGFSIDIRLVRPFYVYGYIRER